MKTWMFSMAMVGLTVAVAFTPLRAQQTTSGGRSVWDGVYTESQAKRGGQIYATHCVSCHGDTLQGDGPASALSGPGFTADFNGASLGEMLDRTRTTMPEDKPGTMSRQQVADVLAYLLSFNKFPAGDAELPTQAEALNQIKFFEMKPTGKTDTTRRRP